MSKLIHVEQAAPGAREARKLVELYQDVQSFERRMIALGLFGHEIKAACGPGRFGAWLKEHCPELCREVNGKTLPSGRLWGYMNLAKSALDAIKVGLPGWFVAMQIKTFDLAHGGEVLLLPEEMVPEELKPLREKICKVIDGKTQQQLFLEFKTAEQDDSGEITVASPLGKHHPRKAKGPSPDQQLKAKIEAQVQVAETMLGDMAVWLKIRPKEGFDDALWHRILDLGVEVTTEARDYLKGASKRAGKSKSTDTHGSNTLQTLKQLSK